MSFYFKKISLKKEKTLSDKKRPNTTKLLEENKGVNLCYLRLGDRFLGITLNDEEKFQNDDYCLMLFK